MDITVIRTFLEVSVTGSFVSAAQSLFVTQSAVSLRIQRLEDELGQPLFQRSRAGAVLTPAGRAFERHAQELVRVWEAARRQVAVPEGFDQRLSLGVQDVLWPGLGAAWVGALRRAAPRLSLHLQTAASPEALVRGLVEGAVQVALTHAPTRLSGLTAERVLEDELVLVAAASGEPRYAHVDWGAEVARAQALHPPLPGDTGLTASGLTLALGPHLRDFVLAQGLAAYLPAGAVADDLAAGRLHRVPRARRYAFPAWAVWRADGASEAANVAVLQLKSVAERASSANAPATTDRA